VHLMVGAATMLIFGVIAFVQYQARRDYESKLAAVTAEIDDPRRALDVLAEHFGADDSPRVVALRSQLSEQKTQLERRLHAEWVELFAGHLFDHGWEPLAFTADNQQLYVASNLDGDTKSIHLLDPSTRQMGPPVFSADGYDVDEVSLSRTGNQLLSIDYHDAYPQRHLGDNEWRAIYEAIDVALTGTTNRIVSIDPLLPLVPPSRPDLPPNNPPSLRCQSRRMVSRSGGPEPPPPRSHGFLPLPDSFHAMSLILDFS